MQKATIKNITEDIRFAPSNAKTARVITYGKDPDTGIEHVYDIIEFDIHTSITTRGKLKVVPARALEISLEIPQSGKIVLKYLGGENYDREIIQETEFTK